MENYDAELEKLNEKNSSQFSFLFIMPIMCRSFLMKMYILVYISYIFMLDVSAQLCFSESEYLSIQKIPIILEKWE